MGKLAKVLGKINEALDMREAARMQRAKDAGFHENTLFHGTAAKPTTTLDDGNIFDEFKLWEGKDPTRSTVNSEVSKLGVSLAEQPGVAEDFASLASRNGSEGSTLLPLRFRSDKTGSIDLQGDELNSDIYGSVVDSWRDGYDAIQFNNYTTPQGKKGSFVLVKDPSQIRSVNAAFDPAKKDSANLLAGLGGAGLIGGATLGSDDAEASFIGRAARTFSEKALKLAEDMSARGAHRDEIWQATGEQFGAPTMKGADGQWRQEISDAGAAIDPSGLTLGESQLDSVISHPELYDSYPELADRALTIKDLNGPAGSFNPSSGNISLDGSLTNNPKEALSTGLHESQHAIQEMEGFARGTSVNSSRIDILRAQKAKEVASHNAEFFAGEHRRNLANAGYDEAQELSGVARQLEEIDRLDGYLKSYRNGGKLTDKRRNIFSSGASILDPAVEYRLRMDTPISKRHRPQAERDAQYAQYIEKAVSAAKEGLDPDLVNIVRGETVKRPLTKYQRKIDGARKSAEGMPQFAELKAVRKKEEGINQLLNSVDADSFDAPRNLYHKSAGEVESRTVQERLPLSLDDRISTPPWQGREWVNTPISDQIVLGRRGAKDYGLAGLAGLGGAGILGASMLTPEQVQASEMLSAQDNDRITADEFPVLEGIGGFLEDIEAPIPLFERPLQGFGSYLRHFGEPRSLKQRVLGAIDASPI